MIPGEAEAPPFRLTVGLHGCRRCMLLCHAPKKSYYKKFLFEPFPVESHLDAFLHDHLAAEVPIYCFFCSCQQTSARLSDAGQLPCILPSSITCCGLLV